MPTEVEPRFTGAVIGTISWVPEINPFSPEVVPFPDVPPVPGVVVVPPDVAAESPKTPAETEPTFTGTVIGATT
jgi:hypothetical protein